MRIKNKYFKIFLRIILSPIIFCYSVALLIIGSFFPLPLLVIVSLFYFIIIPFIWLLNLTGSKLEYPEAFFDGFKNLMFSHFIGMTIYIWGSFYIIYLFLRYGEVFTIN